MKTFLIASAFVGVFAWSVAAQDTKVQQKDLPAPVQKAAQAELAKGGKLVGYGKEVENGKTEYEMETIVNGHTRDLLFDATGKLLEVEEEVAREAVPPAVSKAIGAKGTYTKIESVTKNGTLVGYESIVKNKAGKNVEVMVDATGKAAKF